MKKLFTLLFAASLALTIQAQDITNTLGTDGRFFVNETGGTPSYLTLSSTDNHVIQFSDADKGFQIKNNAGATIFNLNDMANIPAFATFIVGADAGNNWDDGNFAHLQIQQSFALYGTAINELKMIGRGAHNFITGLYANESGTTATDVVDNNTLMAIHGKGFFSTAYRDAAQIAIVVDGTPSGNFVPGGIVFRTAPTDNTPQTRMTIKSDGKVGIGTSAPTSTLDVAGSVSKPITIQTTNYTATENDYTIIFTPPSGTLTLSLPAAADCEGRIYVVRNTRVGLGDPIITIDPNGAELIDGLLATLTVGYNQILPLGVSHSVTIQSDGTGWWVISATMYN